MQIDGLEDNKPSLCVFNALKMENDVEITSAIGWEGLHSDNVPSWKSEGLHASFPRAEDFWHHCFTACVYIVQLIQRLETLSSSSFDFCTLLLNTVQK